MASNNMSTIQKQQNFQDLKLKVKSECRCDELMHMINHSVEKTEGSSVNWYLSPFRDENSASFKVDTATNSYIDFGEELRYRDVIELAMRLSELGKITFDSKFRHLSPMARSVLWLADTWGINNQAQNSKPTFKKHQQSSFVKPTSVKKKSISENATTLKSVSTLKNKRIIDYFVNERKINETVVKNLLEEVSYTFPKYADKQFFSAGFKNRSGGYELRSPGSAKNPKGFKGAVSPKDISLIKGSSPTLSIDLFEGFTDMMTLCTIQNKASPSNNTIVLNSTSMVNIALELLMKMAQENKLKRVYAYIDNDKAGQETLHALKYGAKNDDTKSKELALGKSIQGLEDIGIEVIAQNDNLYPKHNDLNELVMSIHNENTIQR